ncbi:MAG: hypothetical protein JWQ02_2160, partial [Capsulimonas sp.]|nr:hypothetical protein [Capsulimonas sp.]
MQSRREFLGQAVILAGGLILPAGVEAAAKAAAALSYDVVIYGGTSAAVTAAIQTARMGKSVAIV